MVWHKYWRLGKLRLRKSIRYLGSEKLTYCSVGRPVGGWRLVLGWCKGKHRVRLISRNIKAKVEGAL